MDNEVKIDEQVDGADDVIDDSSEIITSAYVDRIETVENGVDKAVLYFGDGDEPEKVIMPTSMLPEGVRADDTLIIRISFDNGE